MVYIMIRSFKCKQTEMIFYREYSPRFPAEIQQAALRKLRMIHRSVKLEDLKCPPANRLEALRGDRRGQHSIRINSKWRICFEWRDGNADRVEIVDYH